MAGLIDRISPFIVMDILAKARTMPDAIHMEVGEPDLPPSPYVIEAYEKAVRDGKTQYTPAKGLPELRERIANYYSERYGVNVSPERIIITPGTSGAFLVIFGMLTDTKKRLVLSDPSYPCYKNFSYFLGVDPVFIDVGKETHYEILPEMIDPEITGAVVVSSPANPTGNLYRDETVISLIESSERNGYWYISDEIYHGLVYEKDEHTALEYSDRVIVINSFSKYFCMPGYRIGWMILPEELVRKAEIIVQNIFIAASTPAQYAAIVAFDDDYLKKVRDTFKRRRDFIYSELKDIFTIDAVPDGAFYIWTDISKYNINAEEFCKRLLEEKAVAITPGVDFGKNKTSQYVRFAYTREIDELKEGIRRIKEFLSSI